MKKQHLISALLISFLGINSQIYSQESVIDTNFCKYLTEFLLFHNSNFENNVIELDLKKMGLDSIKSDNESQEEFELRNSFNPLKRMKFENVNIYKVKNPLYNPLNAAIYHDLKKDLVYFKEEIVIEGDIFSIDYLSARDQIISLFTGCKDCIAFQLVKEEFDYKSAIPESVKGFYTSLIIDVYKLKNLTSDLRYVVNVNNSSSRGHLDIYLVHKDFIKEIVLN